MYCIIIHSLMGYTRWAINNVVSWRDTVCKKEGTAFNIANPSVNTFKQLPTTIISLFLQWQKTSVHFHSHNRFLKAFWTLKTIRVFAAATAIAANSSTDHLPNSLHLYLYIHHDWQYHALHQVLTVEARTDQAWRQCQTKLRWSRWKDCGLCLTHWCTRRQVRHAPVPWLHADGPMPALSQWHPPQRCTGPATTEPLPDEIDRGGRSAQRTEWTKMSWRTPVAVRLRWLVVRDSRTEHHRHASVHETQVSQPYSAQFWSVPHDPAATSSTIITHYLLLLLYYTVSQKRTNFETV